MIILIDGYNLLHQRYPGQKQHFDRLKNLVIKQLSAYKRARAAVTEVIVVFDGGIANHAIRTVKAGIALIEAGTKSSADDWIANFAERHRGREMTLVSNDRALKDRVSARGCTVLTIDIFYQLMLETSAADTANGAPQDETVVIYSHEEDDQEALVSKQTVDMLMMQVNTHPREKPEDPAKASRSASGYTPSRAEKRLAEKLKKLR